MTQKSAMETKIKMGKSACICWPSAPMAYAISSSLTISMPIGIKIAMNLALDKMNRLVVPKAVRERFALKPGDELEMTVEPDGIRLRPVQPASPISMEKGIPVCSSEVPTAAWDLGAFIEQQRGQRVRELGGL